MRSTALIAASLTVCPALAQTPPPGERQYWDGGNVSNHNNGVINGGSGVWAVTGSNWTDATGLSNGSLSPPGFAIFQGASGTVRVDNSLGAVGVIGMQFAADGYRIEGDALDAGAAVRVGDGTGASFGWTATIASALYGTRGLTKRGSGTLILAGDSTYIGGTTVSAGSLQIGDGASAGSILGSVNLASGTSLIFARSDNHDFRNGVRGAGHVIVRGTATLSGEITTAGGVDVDAGSHATVSLVRVNRGSAVTVGLNGSLTVAAGGGVSSRNGVGVQGLATGVSVTNSGNIYGGDDDHVFGGAANSGVRLIGGGTVTNLNGGRIDSQTGEGINAIGASVLNAAGGTITGSLHAVFLSGAGSSVDNSGTIIGGHSGFFSEITRSALTLNDGGVLINRAGGLITTDGGHGVVSGSGIGTITNAGSIQGLMSGIRFGTGGSLTNTGSISGATGVDASTATQVLNLISSGSITGWGGTAITLGGQADTVWLQAGSATSGSVLLGAGADALTLAGGLTGSADAGAGADLVTLMTGGSVSGQIDGGADADVFALDGAGTGSIDIGSVLNFESRVKNGAGIWVLTGADASTAGWTVNAGVLTASGGSAINDAAFVDIALGGTLALLSDETIGALFGTGDVDVGAGHLTFGGVESGFGGRLSGSGQLVHTGGLFTLAGDHTIASISNTGGELRFLGTTTGGLSVSGGSVTGAGTIGGALTVSNGAILSPGLAGVQNGIGGFIAGSLTLNGSTLAIDVLGTAGGNLIDQLRVNGTATLTGGLLAPTFQGPAATDFDFSTRYLFLQADNLVGTFANGGTFTAAAQPGLFWRVRYDLSPNAAVLELRKLTNFDPGATGTANQRSVGQALSGGQLAASDDWVAILSLIAGLNDAQRAAAFDSISGESLADVTTSIFSANDVFITAVRDGGLNGRNDGGEALNFVDRMSFVGGRDNTADRLGDVLGAFDPSASTNRGAGGWVSAYTGDQMLEGKPGQATVESTLNGFAGGYGLRKGSMSIGAAGGVTRLEGDVVARDGHYESDLSHAAGYAAFDDGVWAADLMASFYGGDLDTRRGITVGAFSGQAIGDTHIEGQALSASVARRFLINDNTRIALGAVGTASNASADGYTETGAGGLSLHVSGQERSWQTLQLGARGTQDYRVNGQSFRIYAGAGVLAITGDRQAIGDMRFSGAPTGFGAFTVEGAETPPLAGLANFGLEVGVSEGVTVSAGYRGLFSERLQDNQIGVKLNVSW
ncbi:MAG: autotransporter domain-containing protein [Brevundimonas sp.]|uniref:autotransporter domain-containing protein n=1 Tax=Brevundimonas sp. TaxID=1871086 RepID=UPI00263637CE|nr:autotransporter domain-containing protein [Brevundimonas sp.]MDI6624216.1 autotransporter domain-containing protein [Brevundimonas sp.]MDQ7811800.1 autotransporter domain-containing protein [Brevundimonas sp.]